MKQGREARSRSVGLQPETTPHPQLNPTDTELDRRNARENSEAYSWGSPQPWRATDCAVIVRAAGKSALTLCTQTQCGNNRDNSQRARYIKPALWHRWLEDLLLVA